MKLLVIDSNPKCSFVAYSEGNKLIISRTSDFMSAAEKTKINKSPDKLIECIRHLSALPEIDLKNIDAVSVTIGPGSFTGIRVGLAIAKGIADSLEKKIIPVNNFELMISRVKHISGSEKYCILIPAKLPEYYYSIRENNHETRSGFVQLNELNLIIGNNVIIVGDFTDETNRNVNYFNLNPKEIVSEDELLPEPEAMVTLCMCLYERGDMYDPGEIKPLYLKDFTLRT